GDPAGRQGAALRLSRFQDGRRKQAARTAWRRAARLEPERPATPDFRAPLLAGIDARHLRPPGSAGQGSGTRSQPGLTAELKFRSLSGVATASLEAYLAEALLWLPSWPGKVGAHRAPPP